MRIEIFCLDVNGMCYKVDEPSFNTQCIWMVRSISVASWMADVECFANLNNYSIIAGKQETSSLRNNRS